MVMRVITKPKLYSWAAGPMLDVNSLRLKLPKAKKNGKADWALNHIQKLYRIETQLKGKTIEERYRARQEKSVPLLSQLQA